MGLTTDRDDAGLRRVDERGMQEKYLVLSEEERAKGFVRPLRLTYVHLGTRGPEFPLRDLDERQLEQFGDTDYVKYEEYPEGAHGSALGRYWTQAELDAVGKGCGAVTWMAEAIAETYARNPHFYGGTYCVGCKTHLTVGARGEFEWWDEEGRRPTGILVGT